MLPFGSLTQEFSDVIDKATDCSTCDSHLFKTIRLKSLDWRESEKVFSVLSNTE